MNSKNRAGLVAFVLGLVFAVGVPLEVLAQTTSVLDTTAAVALINTDVKDAIVSVGMGLIGLAAVVLGLKWIKAAFF